MKECTKCKERKPLIAFGNYARAKDGLFPQCKKCKREYDVDYYNSKQGRKEAIKASNETRRQARLEFIGEALSIGCTDCGETDMRVLDFDHVRGEKKDNVTTLVQQMAKWSDIIEEISKCEIRCANCHRKVTADRAGSWRALWVNARLV